MIEDLWALFLARFPAEREPDGHRWYPHHGAWALILYAIGWYLWSPAGHPVLGAALVGLAVALILDDWVSHALGWPTPGDFAFRRLLRVRAFRRVWTAMLRRFY